MTAHLHTEYKTHDGGSYRLRHTVPSSRLQKKQCGYTLASAQASNKSIEWSSSSLAIPVSLLLCQKVLGSVTNERDEG